MKRVLTVLLAASVLFSSASAEVFSGISFVGDGSEQKESSNIQSSFGAGIYFDEESIPEELNPYLESLDMTKMQASNRVYELSKEYQWAESQDERDRIFSEMEKIALVLKNELHLVVTEYEEIKRIRSNSEGAQYYVKVPLSEIVEYISGDISSEATQVALLRALNPDDNITVSSDTKSKIIPKLEYALVPGCIEEASFNDVEKMRHYAEDFIGICGTDEDGKLIDDLCQKILSTIASKKDGGPLGDGSITFSDVKEHEWFYNSVMTMARKGYVNGKVAPVNGVGMFYPQDTITRAEYIAVIIRMMYPTDSCTAKEGEPWWQGYYDEAISKGFVEEQDKVKDPELPITREEMAYISYKAAVNLFGEASNSKNTDEIKDYIEVDARYQNAVAGAYAAKLLTGDENDNFNPKDNSTRAEASTVFYRFLKDIENGGFLN